MLFCYRGTLNVWSYSNQYLACIISFLILHFIIVCNVICSLTINADLAVSIFVCGVEECFCLRVSQISAILGKTLQYKPEKSTGCCRERSLSDCLNEHRTVSWTDFVQYAVYWTGLVSFLCICVSVFLSSSLELFLLYEAASVHIQNLEDLLDVFS